MDSQLYRDLTFFLAHCLKLEEDACQRLEEFSDAMRLNKHFTLATIFDELSQLSQLHASEIKAICSAHKLPVLKPWQYRWKSGDDSPEMMPEDRIDYTMTQQRALELMLAQEQAAAEFYSDVASHAQTESIRQFASEFAEEERQHAHLLERRLRRINKSTANSECR